MPDEEIFNFKSRLLTAFEHASQAIQIRRPTPSLWAVCVQERMQRELAGILRFRFNSGYQPCIRAANATEGSRQENR